MKKKIYTLLFSCVIGVSIDACDDFGDIDKNPNASETPLTSALLTSGLSTVGNFASGGTAVTTGLYAQYFSQTQYTSTSLYAPQDIDWSAEAAGRMMDFQKIIDINSDPQTAANAALTGSNANQIAIARILKAHSFSILTDRYGDMPYFEALKGIPNAGYDAQEEIYSDLFKELDEAVEMFDNGAPVKGDIVYGGENESWQKFANSFRLILALRISKVNPTLGAQQFNDAINSPGGVFESNEDNAKIVYPGPPFANPWFANGADQAISATIASHLNANADARRAAFGKPASGGNVIGVPYGLTREDAIAWTAANPNWSLILNDQWRAQASTLFILTYADVLLAKAEAAFLGWTTEDESVLYAAGIQASWEQWNVFNAGAFSNYINDPDVALSPGTEAQKIATQRWITFYPNGPQGWAEWRRTGFPALSPTVQAVNNSKQIPVRFPFPSVEYTYNPQGVAPAVSRMGGDTDVTRVWWDVD